VKPNVISLFSDIALAIEGEFERYLNIVLGIIKQAGEVVINTEDEDLIEYINVLRNSILEAYTGIILVSTLLNAIFILSLLLVILFNISDL
jgi:importin subunit beta-1